MKHLTIISLVLIAIFGSYGLLGSLPVTEPLIETDRETYQITNCDPNDYDRGIRTK